MKKAGLLFTLVGPAGVGKNQLMKYVMAHSPTTQLPTATTRGIRDGEKEGREHFFVTDDTFLQMIAEDEMLEWQKVHRRYYGMVRKVVEDALTKGQPIIADIDIYGAMEIKERYPQQTVSIFIQPPSIGSLIERMRTRGDRETEISKRLLRVPLELELASKCDYIVVNDTFEHAAEAMLDIVFAEMEGHANRPASVHVQLPHAYQYAARVVPLRGDQLLCREGDFPTAIIRQDEQPYERALDAIKSELGILPDVAHLVHGEMPNDKFIPPLSMDYAVTANGEQITFNYLYRIDQNILVPDGWHWTPIHTQPNLDFVKGLAG